MNIRIIIIQLFTFILLTGCNLEGSKDKGINTPTEEPIIKQEEETIVNTTIYTVSFNTNGGSSIEDLTVENGNKIIAPGIPTKLGNSFVGWFKEAELTNEWNFDTDVVNSDMVLYSEWLIESFNVTFDVYGITSTVIVNYGDTVIKPADPVKDGYTFVCWYSDSTLTTLFDFSTTITTNITLYPYFEVTIPVHPMVGVWVKHISGNGPMGYYSYDIEVTLLDDGTGYFIYTNRSDGREDTLYDLNWDMETNIVYGAYGSSGARQMTLDVIVKI